MRRGLARSLTAGTATAVVFALLPAVPATTADRELLRETFHSGTFPPPGWSAVGTWEAFPGCTPYIPASGLACASITHDDSSTAQTLRLPGLPIVGADSPHLSFDLWISDPDGVARLDLHASVDGFGWDGYHNFHNATVRNGLTHESFDLTGVFAGHLRFSLTQPPGATPARVKIDNVVVTKTNTPPTALPVTRTTNEDSPTNVTLQGGDADGDPVAFSVTDPPDHGTLTGTAPGLTYTPDPHTNGADTFTYVTADGVENSAPAIATVNVLAINDAPEVDGPDTVTVAPGGTAFFHPGDGTALTVSDPDAGGSSLQLQLSSLAPMTLGSTAGLTFTTGDGTDDQQITAQGTLAAINAALTPLRATPTATTNLNVTIDDLGNTPGPARQGSHTTEIRVSAAAGSTADALVGTTPDRTKALGNGTRNSTAAGQTLTLPRTSGGDTTSAYLFVQNDGTGADTFTVVGGTETGDVTTRYLRSSTDVTAAVRAGTFTSTVAAGGTLTLTLRIETAQALGSAADRRYQMTATALTSGTADTVAVVLPLSALPVPDLVVSSEQFDDPVELDTTGYGVRNLTGVGQAAHDVAEIGGAANRYTVRILNDGTPGPVRLRANVSDRNLTVRVHLLDDRDRRIEDVTAAVFAGTAQHVLRSDLGFEVTVAVGPGADAGSTGTVTLTSSAGGRAVDRALVKVTAARYRPDLTLDRPSTDVAAGEPATYALDLHNAMFGVPARVGDVIVVQGTGSGQGFDVRYLDDVGSDVTESVVEGNYARYVYPRGACRNLGCAEVRRLRAVVTPTHGAASGASYAVRVTARSTTSTLRPPASDTVETTTRLAYHGDVAIGETGAPVGDGILSADGSGQVAKVLTQPGLTSSYVLRVRNGLHGSEQTLKGTATGGMRMRVFSGSEDVTAALLGASGFTVPTLRGGEAFDLQVRLTPSEVAGPATTHKLTVSVRPAGRPKATPDMAILEASIGGPQCTLTTVSFDMIRATGPCLSQNDAGWLSRGPLNVNGIDFAFPSGSGALVRSAPYTPGRFAPIDVPWIRSADAVISVGGAALYRGPLNLRLGGPGSTTLELSYIHGEMEGGVRVGDAETFLLFFSQTEPGVAKVELEMEPPPLFHAEERVVPLTTNNGNTAGQRRVMTWPLLSYASLGMVGVTTIYDPATKEWTGYGRIGFPKVPVTPRIQCLFKFTLNKFGTPQVGFFFMRLGLGVAAVPVAPLVTLNSLEAAVEQSPLLVYGKANFSAVPVNSLGVAQLARVPGSVFGVDGAFAYEERTQRLTINGDLRLLNLFTLVQSQLTATQNGVRANARWNYSVDMGPLGTVGLDMTFGGTIATNGFELEGSGTASVGGISGSVSGVISSVGIGGCASVGGIGGGAGLTWGGDFDAIFGRCSLSRWRLDAIQHIDVGAVTKGIDAQILEADGVAAAIDSLPADLRSKLP